MSETVTATATTTQTKGRSRSNSLQRMLELEKSLSRQRNQASNSDGKQYPPSPARPQELPQRRFELVPKDGQRAPPIPVRQHSSVPSSPVAKTHPTETASSKKPASPVDQESKFSTPEPVLKTETTRKSDEHHSKNVAFMFPPQVEERPRAVCQSPTWEAYDRRKKEKKEEKKEKDEAVKTAKPRGRKLTKPMPQSASPSVASSRGRSPAESQQPKTRGRSSSFLGFSLSSKDDPDRSKRARSGSLSSIIRSSFETRRASFDQTSATGFLGGMKLERKKQDFHEHVLADQANGESAVHPALRKKFQGHGAFTPLKTGPPSSKDKEADAQRRMYPPISINTHGPRHLAADSPQTDSPNIYLWSARAKKSAHLSNSCAVADDTEDEGEQVKDASPQNDLPAELPTDANLNGLGRRGGVHIKNPQSKESITKSATKPTNSEKKMDETEATPSPSLAEMPTKLTKEAATAPQKEDAEKDRPPIVARPAPRPRGDSSSSISSRPPPPPRRSSKRGKESPVQKERSSMESLNPFKDKRGKVAPPSVRYESTSPGVKPKPFPETKPALSASKKWSLARSHTYDSNESSPLGTSAPSPDPSHYGRQRATETQRHNKPQREPSSAASRTSSERETPMETQSTGVYRPATSSSDDTSFSDNLQSTTPSTPDSSPPQSERSLSAKSAAKQLSPVAATLATKRAVHYVAEERSRTQTPVDKYPNPASEADNSDVDPVEAASRRVLEAFSNANLRSPTVSDGEAESSSGESSSNESHYAPTPPRQPEPQPQPQPQIQRRPTLRHKGKSQGRLRTQQSVQFEQQQAPVPPPAVTVVAPEPVRHRPHHQLLGSSALEATPLRQQQPRLSLNTRGGDPVAKMFVECCQCKFYQDMPSQLYEAMVHPEGVLTPTKQQGFMGKVSMTVGCPWCEHEMSIKCCAGFAARVIIQERFH